MAGARILMIKLNMVGKMSRATGRRTLAASLAGSGLALAFFSMRALTGPATVDEGDAEAERQIATNRACVVTVEFTARPGEAPILVAALQRALPQTRVREGCERLELIVNPRNEDEMMIVMLWRTRADYDAYRGWREANGDVGRFERATLSGLKTRFFNTVTI